MVGCPVKPRSSDVATCRQTVEAYSRRFHRLAADGYDSAADQTNVFQRKKGYFFIRLFAMSPPKPNSVPITIMLGSGTAGGASEDRLATRKPML
jgi:hypothetical protein